MKLQIHQIEAQKEPYQLKWLECWSDNALMSVRVPTVWYDDCSDFLRSGYHGTDFIFRDEFFSGRVLRLTGTCSERKKQTPYHKCTTPHVMRAYF